MKTYRCTCGRIIFFENVSCIGCGRELGFVPNVLALKSLEPAGDGFYRVDGVNTDGRLVKKCQNYAKENVCNWMVHADKTDECFCTSCRLNQVIPDLSIGRNRALWTLMEHAKRRLVYGLIRLRLPVANKIDDSKQGLGFCFLSDVIAADGSVTKVLTGHKEGLITLNIAEADDGVREQIRLAMNEEYRTLLGHFRHEIGHYYWGRLISRTDLLSPFRELFGNEQQNYNEALAQYYRRGAPPNWQNQYVSAYATAHPWEDWAETWAHFMHIHDALEVADDFGLAGKGTLRTVEESTETSWPALGEKSYEEIIRGWTDLSIALNSINRSMGLRDTYPFVLSNTVINKLRFISDVITDEKRQSEYVRLSA